MTAWNLGISWTIHFSHHSVHILIYSLFYYCSCFVLVPFCARFRSITHCWSENEGFHPIFCLCFIDTAAHCRTMTLLVDEHAPFNKYTLRGLTSDLYLRGCIHTLVCWKKEMSLLEKLRNEKHGKREMTWGCCLRSQLYSMAIWNITLDKISVNLILLLEKSF